MIWIDVDIFTTDRLHFLGWITFIWQIGRPHLIPGNGNRSSNFETIKHELQFLKGRLNFLPFLFFANRHKNYNQKSQLHHHNLFIKQIVIQSTHISRISSKQQKIINIYQKMQIINTQIEELKSLKLTKILEQIFALIIIVGSALALWKCLCVGFHTQCPVVVVLTGSMEPGYYRGDILFVYHQEQHIIPGDVVVYNLRGQAIPIVHRVMTVQQRTDKNLYILTKGDNNTIDDRGLYPRGTLWLHREEIMGKMKFYLPKMGMFTIWLNDYVWFKYTVLGLMGFFVLIAKDPQ